MISGNEDTNSTSSEWLKTNPIANRLNQSIFNIAQEMGTPSWVKEARVPDNDVVFSQRKTNLSRDGLRRPRSMRISVSQR